MEQVEKRKYLIKTLLAEQPRYRDIEIPEETGEQKRLLRSLFNVRMPGKINEDFLRNQDEYLQEAIKEKGYHLTGKITASQIYRETYSEKQTIICDSAEPKSINDLQGRLYPGVIFACPVGSSYPCISMISAQAFRS